ncbi:MAG: phage major capsid protein [Bacteroidota bacterium]|nr:phage major capsid protein [Bacteroidota bacterium]
MAVTMTTFDSVLKDDYQGILRDQINLETSAFFNKVVQTSMNIEGGKRVVKDAPYGVNGGFAAGTESGALPTPGGNKFAQFISGIKDLRGVIRFTDKVMKASQSSKAAFISAFDAETNGIKKHAQMSYGRQAYTDGTGNLTLTGTTNPASLTINVASCQYLVEGMIIDILDNTGAAVANGTQRRIAAVDRAAKTIKLDGTATVATANTGFITEQGAYNNELTGMEAVYKQTGTLYGLDKADYPWLKPFVYANAGAMDEQYIIDVINYVEEFYGSKIDLLTANPAVYSEYYAYNAAIKRAVNTLKIDGGFTAVSINEIPMVKDKNIGSGKLKINDTTQWKMHTFGDWEWMQDNGRILNKVAGYAMWEGVLLKYAELICDHPGGQAEISGITTSSTLFA